jgi:GrpB-like predicted nucleotidyltransferase (UPF0157 family)
MSDMIELLPYDPDWAARFAAERQALSALAGSPFKEIHHIGSTAIPGIAAKPVIDILVELERHEDGFDCSDQMRTLGYEYRGIENPTRRHYYLRRQPFRHHVHMQVVGHPEVRRLLEFRDYLRSHSDEAKSYETLKLDLAKRFGGDRRAYASAKDLFCDRIAALVAGAG